MGAGIQDTYLDLVTDVITETGLNGGNAPSSVTGAEGDAAKVAYWVRIADQQLQRERIDWDFLWENPTVTLSQSSNVVPNPLMTNVPDQPVENIGLINAIAKDRLAIIDTNGEASFPTYMDWNEFSVRYNYETQAETDFPSFWTIRPDRAILLSEPLLSADLTCKYEYWRKPIKLRNDSDISLVPLDFTRLIVLLAKILYAEHEDAPEVDVGSTSHYDVILNQMISVHAPESEWQRMESSDQLLVVETR